MEDEKHNYSGMTVNERLFHAGVMEKFETAVDNRDWAKVKAILSSVEINDQNISEILSSLEDG